MYEDNFSEKNIPEWAFSPYDNNGTLYDPQKGPRAYGHRTPYFAQEEMDDDMEQRMKSRW